MRHSVLKAGADGFLTKPIESLAGFQSVLLSKLPDNQQVLGPRAVIDETIIPDPNSYCDDLRHASKLKRAPIQSQDYIFSFLDRICRSRGDVEIIAALKDRNIKNLRIKIRDRITELVQN